MPVIRISDKLYSRLEKLAVGFDTPANVIERLLIQHEGGDKMIIKDEIRTNKITKEIIEEAYLLSKQIFEKKLYLQDAQTMLVENFGMHEGSARDYLNNFQKMMEGECYQRTMNGDATEYYLKKIREDFGEDSMKVALDSVKKHIKYYEQFSNGKLQKIRKIVDNMNAYS